MSPDLTTNATTNPPPPSPLPKPVITSSSNLVRDGNGEVTITGSAPSGVTVRVYEVGNGTNSVDAPCPSGTFSAKIALAAGQHTIRAEISAKMGGFDEVTVQVT